jgi:hypothetical protein
MAAPRDPTQFTRDSARRIAQVVRAAEIATPPGRPLNWEPILDPKKVKLFRVGTYEAPWPIETDKVVTFKNVTSTPNTANVTNLFFELDNPTGGGGDCGIAKEGTSWYLISVPLRLATVNIVESISPKDVITSGTTSRLTFFSTASTAVIRTFESTSEVTVTPCETGGEVEVLTDVTVSFDPNKCEINVEKQTQTIKLTQVGDEVTIPTFAGSKTALGISLSATQTANVVTGLKSEQVATIDSMFTANVLIF